MMNNIAIPLRSASRASRTVVGRRLRGVVSVLSLPVLALATANAQQYNYAGGGCTATFENRTTLIDTDGTWVIPNVPELPGQYTVHIACPQLDGSLLDAYSPFYNLLGTPGMNVPLLPITTPFAQPQKLVLTIASGSLAAAGSQLQLAALQIFADGSPQDATLAAEGTTYFSSNPAVATISPDGLVTAVGAGSLTVTANNNGLVATIQIPSFASLDSDGDGMSDTWEIANGLNPYDPTDAALDPDGDGLTNLQEYQLGTNPHVADTDGDGLTDGQEVKLGTNPLLADTDGDGLSDGQEVALGTNPLLADTDGDGIPDGVEVKIGTNPLVPDATTVVTGYVTNGDGTPSVGTSTVVLTYFNALTDSTGKFTILTVPVTLGNVIATAEAVINTKVYSGSTPSIQPVANGVTNVGTIVLGQNGGQVSGTVTTPDKKAVPGVSVVVTGGADTRTTVTDSNGLYAVSGLPVGQVFVAAIDPATSLRGQAMGSLSGSAPLNLNVQLASFGTVSGLVTDLSSNPVPAGVTVTITGALNASTVTDGVGHYSFAFVPLGAVQVDATDANGNHGRTQGTVTATAQTIVANVQYLGQGTVSGTVADSQGNVSPGATVSLVNNGVLNQRLTTTANSAGQYTLSHIFIGTLNLSAQSTLSAITGNTTATITTNAQSVTANITLQPTGTLSGVVYRVDGTTPVAGATVSLLGTALAATADVHGAYTLPAVPLGSYTLEASDPAGPDAGVTNAALATAGQTVTLNVNLLGLSTVTVTVLDGGGNPNSGAATLIDSGAPFNQKQTGVSASDGTVTFHNVLAVSSLASSATNPATGLSGQSTTALTANQTVPVTIILQSAGTIQGTVYQSDGATPVGGITVSIAGGAQTLTAANGTYSLSNVHSGTYDVAVTDAVGNQLSISRGLTVSTQGQVVTANFIVIARGTVTGTVTFSNGSAAANVSVQIDSSAPNAGNAYGTATDINGNYSILNVPIGAYTAIGQQHTLSTDSYGTASGNLASNGATAVTNIALSSQLVPSSVAYNDANGFQYSVHQDGSIFDGSFNVFQGDGANNRGASLLSLIQNGKTTPFTGEDFAPADLSGRQISYTQNGLDGLTVTRRVYVPADGYFARYLELISNPGVSPVTVGLQLTTNFALAGNATILNNTYYLSADVPQIVTTSSGDQVLNINDPTTPDHWLTLGGSSDRDPFLPDAGHIEYVPTIADVFDAPGAALTPTSAVYNTTLSATNSQLTETYGTITVPAGGTVGILHFLSQENLYESAAAAAARLEQLPPEALLGLSASDLATVVNFPVPSGGVSTLPALTSITNQVTGTVFAYDGATPVPNAPVFFTSTDPIYARFYQGGTDANGNFNFQGSIGGIPVPYAPFSIHAWEPNSTTPSTAVCRQAGLFYGAGCAVISPNTASNFDVTSGATTATGNTAFTNTGILTGTVSRGPNVLNAAGTVTLSGGPMLPITVNIKADGTYTFLDVLPGTYNLLASVNNTLLTGLTTTTTAIGVTTTTNITIIEAGTVTGSVTRPDSTLAIGDVVNLRIAGQNPLTTVVDTSGHYAFTDVPIGAFEVDCYDSLSNTAASATATIANGVTLTENLALQSAGTVNGAVTANDGSNVSGVTVTLASATSSGTQTLATVTNTTGAFSFTNVKPGSITLRATNSEGLQGTSTGSLPIAGQTVTLNIALLAAGNLQGTVFQGDGTTPAANVNVTISPAPLTGSATVTTNASGVYNFSNVQVGYFNLTATNPVNGDQGTASGQIQVLNQQRTVNVTLNGFGNLAVTVLSPTNAAVPDASVTVTTEGIGSTHTLTTNANGIAQFTGLFAGPYSVSAKDPVSGLSTYNGGSIAYNQSASVTLTLQALATIQGTVFQPDGVTPQAGATVNISGYVVKSVVTGANGTYQFANIPTGYYSLSAQDAGGRTRAYANSVQLQGNGSTLTQNLTFVGIGSVSGTVLNVDGSVAVNASLTLTSQNAITGGSQTTNSQGDGTYNFNEVPVGKVTVSVNGLPSGEIGYGSGTITIGQNSVINIQIQGNAITLPVTLTDADGYPYSIYGNGTYFGNGGSGGLDPFAGTHALGISVGGTQQFFGNNAQGNQTGSAAIQSMNGQQLELTAPVNGLNVTRKIYVPSNGYFARRLEVLQNPTNAPVTATVTLGFGGGFERSEKNITPALVTSSNGTTTLDPTVLWTVDDDDNGKQPYPMTAPPIASVFQGAGAATGLSAITYTPTSYSVGFGQSQYFINSLAEYYTYKTVTIPANGQVSFLFFSAKEATQGSATTAAQRLVQLPPEALAGIGAADLASVVNFVIPNPQTLNPVAQPLGGTLSGLVVAGDNVTPVPNATVYVQSTDLLYGSGLKTTADASGNYSIPTLPANTYAAEAFDPVTGITSATATGAFAPAATAQTQNIPFLGTGIMRGQIQPSGKTVVTSANVYSYFDCAPSYTYCGQASANTGTSNVWNFLTVPAGTANLSANVNTSAAGGYYLTQNGISIPAALTTYVTLTLPATGNVTGVVSNADGTPAAGVTVTTTPATNGFYETVTTGADGSYSFTGLALDTYTITATDPLTTTTVTKSTIVTQDTTNTVNLQFVGKGTVNFTVRYANGNIAANVNLYVFIGNEANVVNNYSPCQRDPLSHCVFAATMSDANGNASVTNLPDGTFVVHAYYPDQSFFSTTTASMSGNGQTVAVPVSLTPVGTISGTLSYPTGTTVPSAYVNVVDAAGIYNTNAQTDSAGNFAFFPVPADRTVSLSSTTTIAGRTAIAKAANQQVPGDAQTLTVNLRYPGAATVQVNLKNADGTTYTNTTVTVVIKSTDGQQTYSSGVTGGSATLTNVLEAPFVAYAYDYTASPAFAIGSTSFTLLPADDGSTKQVTVTAAPTGTVQGTLFAADGTTAIQAGYNINYLDVTTGINNQAYPNFPPGYIFTNATSGAGGFTLTPSLYLPNQGTVTYTNLAFNGSIATQGQTITHNFTLPLSVISGTVYLNDGVTPAPNVNVSAAETISGNTTYYNATTDANGNYQIIGPLGGQLNLGASDANGVSGFTVITVPSDTAILAGQNITLAAAGTVLGTVYDGSGQPQPNIDVTLSPSANNGGVQITATSDANGNYNAPDIPVGTVSVSATLNDGTVETNAGTLLTNASTITVNLGTPPPSGTIFGTVYDSTQAPAPGAVVTATSQTNGATFTATTDGNGLYTITGVGLDTLSVAAVLADGVTAVTPTIGTVTDLTVPVEIDLGLMNAGNASGTITDSTGAILANVNVNSFSTGDTTTSISTSTDSNGVYYIGGLAPGTVTIQVLDSKNNVTGSNTGVLPFGGNVTIDVKTMQVGANLHIPNAPATGVQVAGNAMTATQRAAALARVTHASSLTHGTIRTMARSAAHTPVQTALHRAVPQPNSQAGGAR